MNADYILLPCRLVRWLLCGAVWHMLIIADVVMIMYVVTSISYFLFSFLHVRLVLVASRSESGSTTTLRRSTSSSSFSVFEDCGSVRFIGL